jgi:hypothetical protein
MPRVCGLDITSSMWVDKFRLSESQRGLSVQEALVLKIEPRTRGGDTR